MSNGFTYTIQMPSFTINIVDGLINTITANESGNDFMNNEFNGSELGNFMTELIQSRVNSEVAILEADNENARLNEEIDKLYEKLTLAEKFIEENRGELG